MEKKIPWVPLLAAGVGGVVLWHYASTPSNASAKTPTMPNPADAQIVEQANQERAAVAQSYDSAVLGSRQIAAGKAVSFKQANTARKIAFNQTASAEDIANLESTMEQAIARIQGQTYTTLGQDQVQVAQGQQSTSLWQSILGFFGGALPFLGPSGASGTDSIYTPLGPSSYDEATFPVYGGSL